MKKLFLMLALASLALVACNKDETDNDTSTGNSFVAGQKVTITASAGDKQTRVSSSQQESGQIDFTWEQGDEILVTVGGASATFTLQSGAGTSDATFSGNMPASGSKFDMQYPVEDPDLSYQSYDPEDEPIPHNKMKFVAKDCELSTTATFSPMYSVIQLNLYGTGNIDQIVVTNETTLDTYTLDIIPALTLESNEEFAKASYIVVPEGEYMFSAEVFDISDHSASVAKFTTGGNMILNAGELANMPAKEVKKAQTHEYVDLGLTVLWATCNIGAENPQDFGDYFAWGETQPYYHSQDPLVWEPEKDNGYDWMSYCGNEDSFVEWSPEPYDMARFTLTADYDAATVNWGDGWRMPTWGEIQELIDMPEIQCSYTSDYKGSGVSGFVIYNVSTAIYDISVGLYKPHLFFPSTGYYNGKMLVDANNNWAYYWSSSIRDTDMPYSYSLKFEENGLSLSEAKVRYEGLPIRPVRPKVY